VLCYWYEKFKPDLGGLSAEFYVTDMKNLILTLVDYQLSFVTDMKNLILTLVDYQLSFYVTDMKNLSLTLVDYKLKFMLLIWKI